MKIYDDSKTYIVNEELENTVSKIRDILREKQPYRDIPKLPELLDHFRTIYGGILDEQEKPVKSAINDSYQRVMDVLDTKSYVAEKKEAYGVQFKELFDGVEHCNNVSVLRSYADRADALKIRLLNEMDAKDKQIAEKEAEEEKRKAEEDAKKNGQQVTPVVVTPHIKTTKNVPIKSVTGTSYWRLESQEDIDKYINALKKKLTAELKDDTIINIEF